MALIWTTNKKGRRYEVRSAGGSVRLYTDGVFHSQWNPRRPLAGHLWDLLFLPTLFHKEQTQLNKALILGVGGGAVINALNHFIQPQEIIGVDLDPVHLLIAKRYFLESFANVLFVESDAKDFIKKQPTASIDLIIEDLFCGAGHNASETVRAIPMDDHWLKSLGERLNSSGILVINFENPNQLRRALRKSFFTKCGFESLYQLTMRRYENAIAVCLKLHEEKVYFNEKLKQLVYSTPSQQVRDLNFNLCRLF